MTCWWHTWTPCVTCTWGGSELLRWWGPAVACPCHSSACRICCRCKGLCHACFATCHGQQWPKDGACPACLCRSPRSRCSARLMKLQSCKGGVSCGRRGPWKVSALPLGETGSFSIQIKVFPWCFGVTDQQGSWISCCELPNCW